MSTHNRDVAQNPKGKHVSSIRKGSERQDRFEEPAPRVPEKTISTIISPGVWLGKIVSGTLGLLGFGGLLYGIGFLTSRSHYSFWGIWNGMPDESAVLVSEGGRFLFRLFFVVLDVVNPFSQGGFRWLSVAIVLLFGLALVPAQLLRRAPTSYAKVRRLGYIASGVLALAGTVTIGSLLLQDVAFLLGKNYILTPEFSQLCSLKQILLAPQDAYFERVGTVVLLIALVAVAFRAFQLLREQVNTLLVSYLMAILLAIVSLLPAIAGRLAAFRYPTVVFPANPTEPVGEKLLIRATNTHWIIWNLHDARTEVYQQKDRPTVYIGHEKPLIEPKNIQCPEEKRHE